MCRISVMTFIFGKNFYFSRVYTYTMLVSGITDLYGYELIINLLFNFKPTIK